jgi:hypothetical protein
MSSHPSSARHATCRKQKAEILEQQDRISRELDRTMLEVHYLKALLAHHGISIPPYTGRPLYATDSEDEGIEV